MHELSIAARVVEEAGRIAAAAGGRPTRVTLRIGPLAGVHEPSLRAAYGMLREGTPLADAELAVEAVPLRVWCGACRTEHDVAGPVRLACPACGRPTGEIRAGRELDIESITLEDAPAAPPLPPHATRSPP